eukprot:gene9921-13344_t
MSMARGSRMLRYINYRMRITLQDSRILVGTFMAFDRHMNIVLADTEEYRKIKSKKTTGIAEEREEKRALGLIILRGDSVVSMTIEGPPPPELDEKATPGGPGVSKAQGRGMPVAPIVGAPIGLTGPVRGVGGPGLSIMQPAVQIAAQMNAQPLARGLPMPPPMGMGGVPPRPPPGTMLPGNPPRGMPGPPMPGMAPPPGMMLPRPPGGPLPPRG